MSGLTVSCANLNNSDPPKSIWQGVIKASTRSQAPPLRADEGCNAAAC